MVNMRKCVQRKRFSPITGELWWQDTLWTDIKFALKQTTESMFNEYREIFIPEESEVELYPLSTPDLWSSALFETDKKEIIQCVSNNPITCYSLKTQKLYFVSAGTRYRVLKNFTNNFQFKTDNFGNLV